jgi:hypothetical protein
MSWGLLRPVILIDPDTLDHGEDADAILAHEIAHVVRRDWAVLMLTRITTGLFWFNPLVRVLEREVVQHAEEAADIEAARCVEPTRYARTLVHWAQFNAAAIPANSIAPRSSALSRRVKAILDARLRATPAGSRWSIAAMVACAGFALVVGMLQLIPAVAEARAADNEEPAVAAAPAAPAIPASPAAVAAPAAPAAPLVPGAAAPAAPGAPAVPGAVRAPFAPVAPMGTLAMLHPHHGPVPPTPPVPPHPPVRIHVDGEAISRQVEAAIRAAQRNMPSQADMARIHQEVQRSVRDSLSTASTGLEQGAQSMEAGARDMEREAERLRDRGHRERVIADQARRGRTVTHEQLIESIDELREGAAGMRQGAREMRESAGEMRRQNRG